MLALPSSFSSQSERSLSTEIWELVELLLELLLEIW